MNVYDFDNTIYRGDSSVDFFFYCILNYPRCLKKMPRIIMGILQYMFKMIDTREFKEVFFVFLNELSDIDEVLSDFWDKNEKKIKRWYYEKQEEEDLIISASPDFLLRPIVKRLGIKDVIATNMDKKTGKISGNNCKAQEKVARYKAQFGEVPIGKFYSDSRSDIWLAQMAKQAFLVRGKIVKPWRT